jgi:hypothetical protein
MLNTVGIDSRVVDVEDNNRIDREVSRYKPTHVFIEALWVVPKKFVTLKRLHPHVKWFIRIHSDLSFLANEGKAMDWLFDYVKCGITLTANSPGTAEELTNILKTHVEYLPNYYPTKRWWKEYPKLIKNVLSGKDKRRRKPINIGCFGSIRPLKNQLVQAISAMKFAEKHNKRLRFYINTGRIEGGGDPVLKNIRCLFKNSPSHTLVEIPWLKHEQFIELLEDEIDIGMQVSFSETFNIVTADMVASQVPVVVSGEVYWVSPKCMVDTHNVEGIVKTMDEVCKDKKAIIKTNKSLLTKDSDKAKIMWRGFLTLRH